MSRLIPITVLLAFVLQTGFKMLLYLDYEVNKQTITQKFCENKARPEMKCHGKCHLNKILKESDKRSEPNKNNNREQAEVLPFIQHKKQTLNIRGAHSIRVKFSYLLRETEERPLSFFHPPCELL